MDQWKTDDIGLAAWLKCEGIKVLRVEVEYVGKTSFGYFYFEDCQQLRSSVSEYISGEALVEPRTFSRNYGNLKAAIYEAEGGRRSDSRQARRRAS